MQRKNKQSIPTGMSSEPVIIPQPKPPQHAFQHTSSVPVQVVSSSGGTPAPTVIATVVRRRCGTSPFDKYWLNRDCCGLFCAILTYCLHLYGCYAVCKILIPPWMSYSDSSSTTTNNDANSMMSKSNNSTTALAQNGVINDNIRKLTFWGILNCVIFCTIAFLAVVSHFKAMTTDPGSVPPDAEPIADNLDTTGTTTNAVTDAANGENDNSQKSMSLPPRPKRICRRCHSYKPDRAHHCSICKRCIIKMDHHCPWVNNCVGIGNHKYFLLFIFYTFLSCIYSITLLIIRFMSCMNHSDDKDFYCLDDPLHILNLIGLVVEAFLFGMFTSCMMADQWDVVLTKVTHIDRLKSGAAGIGMGFSPFMMEDTYASSNNTSGNNHYVGVNEVFGTGKKYSSLSSSSKSSKKGYFRLDWLSPFAKVCFPDSIKDDIMGFCRPCGFRKAGEDDYDLGTNNNNNNSANTRNDKNTTVELVSLMGAQNGNNPRRGLNAVTEIV